jgi:hypothetical protein
MRGSVGVAALLLAVTAIGCKSKSDGTAQAAAPQEAPAPPASAAPADPGASPAPASTNGCETALSAFTVTKTARGDVPPFPAQLQDDRVVIGYATGNKPRAAVLDLAAGSASELDVEEGVTATELAPEKGGSLAFWRVTPVGEAGIKFQVGIDAVRTNADKARSVFCGVADGAKLSPEEGEGTPPELRECRTFFEGGKPLFLASTVQAPAEEGGKGAARWFVVGTGEEGAAIERTLATKAMPQTKGDRYAFDAHAAIHAPGAGFVFASRWNGNLVLSKQDETLSNDAPADFHWLGSAIGAPALATDGRRVAVVMPSLGKGNAFGAVFSLDGKLPKPEPLALEGGAEADRSSVSLAFLPSGDLALAYLEAGEGGAKRGRVVVLDGALKPKFAPIDVTPAGAKAGAIRLTALKDGQLLVTTSSGSTLSASVLRCGG